MPTNQREQNPDVNSYTPDTTPGENTNPTGTSNNADDIEKRPTTDVIPVPPDAEPTAPVEEPPGSDKPPVGDVDDSPKKIANNG
jgi:hypothetical protein